MPRQDSGDRSGAVPVGDRSGAGPAGDRSVVYRADFSPGRNGAPHQSIGWGGLLYVERSPKFECQQGSGGGCARLSQPPCTQVSHQPCGGILVVAVLVSKGENGNLRTFQTGTGVVRGRPGRAGGDPARTVGGPEWSGRARGGPTPRGVAAPQQGGYGPPAQNGRTEVGNCGDFRKFHRWRPIGRCKELSHAFALESVVLAKLGKVGNQDPPPLRLRLRRAGGVRVAGCRSSPTAAAVPALCNVCPATAHCPLPTVHCGRNGWGRVRDAPVSSNSIVRDASGTRPQPFLPVPAASYGTHGFGRGGEGRVSMARPPDPPPLGAGQIRRKLRMCPKLQFPCCAGGEPLTVGVPLGGVQPGYRCDPFQAQPSILVKQRFELLECFGCEARNRYDIGLPSHDEQLAGGTNTPQLGHYGIDGPLRCGIVGRNTVVSAIDYVLLSGVDQNNAKRCRRRQGEWKTASQAPGKGMEGNRFCTLCFHAATGVMCNVRSFLH
eukprot:gene5333-biopygen22219